MLALTLIQPMGWAIVHKHKPYENRSRDIRPLAIRGKRTRIAIHNGKKYDDHYGQMVHHYTGFAPADVPMAIIGLATLTGEIYIDGVGMKVSKPPPRDHRDRWFVGPIAFEIDVSESVALRRPVPCRGMLGFWTVPREIEAQIEAQL